MVTGIQEVVVPELISGVLYTMLVAAVVVDIAPHNGVEKKRESLDAALKQRGTIVRLSLGGYLWHATGALFASVRYVACIKEGNYT